MSEKHINKKRNKKRRLSGSTGIPCESTVNEISQSRVLQSSGKLVTSPSHAVVALNPLSITSSGALLPEMGNPSEISYSVSTGKKRKSNMPEGANDDSSDIIRCHRLSYDGKLLDAINSETSYEAVALLTSENSFTQQGLNHALISACRQGHKQLVQTLVRAGADIEHRDEHQNTPLLICAENGFTDIVQFLVSRHANVKAVNSVGNTALILSVRSEGSTDMTKFLLEQQDVDVHHENQHGYTAVIRATYFMDVDTMRLLLEKSVRNTGNVCMSRQETDLSFYKSRSQETMQQVTVERTGLTTVHRILQDHLTARLSPITLAIKSNDSHSLDIFLDCQFSSQKMKKIYIDSALIHVFLNSRHKSVEGFSLAEIKIIQKLLQYGADVNPRNGLKLISYAVESGNIQLVELLCTHGADLKKCGSGYGDPVCIAARNGRRDLIELLLKHNAVLKSSYFNFSALYYALSNDHTECARLLIQSGAKLDVENALRHVILDQKSQYFSFFVTNCSHEVNDFFSQKPMDARNLLLLAAWNGKCEILGQILDAGVGVNEADSSGRTPLMMSRNGEVAEFLIRRGANVNGKIEDENGIETALSHVIGHRQLSDASTVELCKVLIDHGAAVNYRNGHDKTPLMLAAYLADCVSMLEMLLEKGADINNKDRKGNTALFHAVRWQKSKNVTCLIDSTRDKKSLINVQNNDGLTPLIVSVQEGNVSIVKELIDKGADVNMKDKKENSALHHLLISCPGKGDEILTSLLEAGSHVNSQNRNSLSPLMLAAKKTMVSVISTLLDAGADVNAVSKRNKSLTALSFLPDFELSVVYNAVSCIETLINKGANCSYLRQDNFHKLIIENQVTVIPKLIQHGARPSDVEKDKLDLRIRISGLQSAVSPLLIALFCGHVHLAQYFVDILFLTRSDMSMIASNKAVVHLLQQEGLEDSLNFLQELSSQPMSLVKLCLMTVSFAVASSPEHETVVHSCPLPRMLKDRLLFKSVAGEHAALAEIPSKSDSLHDMAVTVSSLRNWEVLKYNDSSDDDYYFH